MDKFYKAKFAFLLLLSGLFTTQKSHAEGSKDLYPAGAGGGRACLVSSSATKGGWPLTTTGVHYAYMLAGETLAAASSAQGIGSGQIIFTAPDGTVYSSTTGSATVGNIANRTQELAGPWSGSGYTPFTRVVGAGQTGLWKVELLSTSPANNLQEGVGANWQADAAWTQSPSSSAICAWDITVRTSGGVIKPGRVYTNVLNMYVQYGDYRGKLWVLTKDGYVFKVNNNGSNGLGFVGFVNNRGLTKSGADSDLPLYKSVDGINLGTNVYTWDPRKDDGTISVTQKMFYQAPDKTMPATAPMAGGKTVWLNPARVVPTISNIAVDGVEGTSGQVSRKGAYITFNANTTGTYRITLQGTGSFVTRKMTGTALAGPNSVFWDGKDGANVSPSLGTANVTANVQLQGSEIHFPFIDVEDNFNGLIIEQMATDNVTVESDIVYWADSTFTVDATASNPLINGNEGTGLSSNTNGHKWGSNFGNNRTMDTWTYVLGDIASRNTSLNIVQADLAVQGITTTVPGTTQMYVGQTVSYTVTVVNNGPSDVTGAPFAIKAPSNFAIGSLSNVTYSTGCGSVVNPAVDASGNYAALLDMPNGCIITFTVTGTATASGAINLESSIMRPKDVTDPDATNPDASVPPTDPHVECKNGGTTETCNNIKYNTSVTALPSANVVVTKTTTATTYVPGRTVAYTFTVANNSPTPATGVHVTDNAPAGTTITAWTAAFTTGTGTLPAAGGTGNIDQTIATLPANAVVTYTVTVTIPSGFTGNLQNTASASSPDDHTPADNTSTTPAITAAPEADIQVTKTTAVTTLAPGEDVVYTVTISNNGPSDAMNVNWIDNAPTNTTIVAWNVVSTVGNVTLSANSGLGQINQTIPSMPSGSSVTYAVTVRTSGTFSGNLVNTASASSPATDNTPANNTATTTPIAANPRADVAISKSTAATSFAPGEDVTYTIVVTNNGTWDAPAVHVTDNAPVGTIIKSWTAVANPATITLPATSGSGNIDQTIASLPNGGQAVYSVTVSTPSNFTGTLSNTAAVTTTATDDNTANNTATTTPISPAPRTDVAVVATSTGTTYTPGEEYTYTVKITNNGPSDAKNVHLVNNAPAGTVIKEWVATATGTVTLPAVSGAGNIDEIIASLAPGEEVTYTIVVTTYANTTGNLSNTATVTNDVTDNVTANNTSTSSLTPAPKADIVVVKSTTATTFASGEDVVYTFTVTNNGPSDAANVVVTDNAPTGTTITSWSAAVTTGSVTLPAASGTGNISQTILNMPNGAVVTYTVTVATPSSFTGSLSNTAAASSDATDNTPANNNSTTPGITPTSKADIAVVKSTTATTFAPGEDVVYTITVTNNGPSNAANVVVTDNAPAGTTIKSWSAAVTTGTVTLPATSGTGNINQTIASVPNAAVVTYTVTVATSSGFTGSLSNTASASSDATDPAPANNSSTTPGITPASKADIVVVKSTTATSFAPGEDVVYTITVANNGPSDAANVVVTDNAPAGTTIKSWTAAVTTGTVVLPATAGTGNISQTIANLSSGALVTYTVTIATPSSFTGNLSNTAAATSDATDNTPGNNTSSTPGIPAAPKADIAVVKATTATTFAPGEDVTYTITVTNNGPSDAANVVVTDNAPTGTTITSWTAAVTNGTVTLPATSGTGNISQTILNMPNGAVVTYTVTVATPSGFTGSLSNTANASSDATDNTPGNNSSTTTSITPAPKADVSVVKSTAATTFAPGENVTYTITVSNNGPSDAANVKVIDNAPTGTSIQSWSAAVTNGTVTLPATSGTGNINQTIAKVPNGAVVTYTVTIATPSGFTGNLSNTATVSSDATDNTPANNTSTTPGIPAVAKADIQVVKATAATTYVPGKDVVYTIKVSNNGPSDAADVNVKDAAPAGTTISAWSASVTTGTVTLPNANGTGNLNETIAKMPNGAAVTYTVTLHVNANVTGNLTNTASATTTAIDNVPANNSSTTPPITGTRQVDLVVVKATADAALANYTPGTAIDYTITVTNNGPSDAQNVTVKDVAPAGTTIRSWTATVVSGNATPAHMNGAFGLDEVINTMSAGSVVKYDLKLETPSSFKGSISNTAVVGSDVTDANPADNTSTTKTLIPAISADVEVMKTLKDAAQTTFKPGDQVFYYITIKNNGPSDASNVNVKDVAPAGTNIFYWGVNILNGTVTLPNRNGNTDINETIAVLPAGAVIRYEVGVQVHADHTGNLTNTATVSSTTPDSSTGNNTSTSPALTDAAKADVAITKKLEDATQTSTIAGKPLVYVITVTNNGTDAAALVHVKDVAPAGTTIGVWTATVVNGAADLKDVSGTGDLDAVITSLPAGAVVDYHVTVLLPDNYSAAMISNTATANSQTADPVTTNNTTTTPALPVTAAADLQIAKTTSEQAYVPGRTIVYTIDVTNAGPSAAQHVNVKDIAPAGTTISAWTATVTNGAVTLPHSNGTGDLDETIVTMSANTAVRYSVTVSVPVDFRGDISNTATVSSTTTDKDQTNNTSTTAALKPIEAADLEVTKQLKDPSQQHFVAGNEVVYLITVKNNGPAPATKVNIRDLAPAGTTIAAWTATVTNGTVTLPNASGTGDLNETIALMPDQSVVTYEVVVKTPETFQGALVNTVDVSSETSDPAPTCAACTAPAVAAEPLPEADQDDYGDVRADNPVTIPVLKNDKPGDVATPLNPKSVEIVQQPAHGTIIINEDGTVVYTPEQGYNGPDSFTYRVQDEHGSWSNVATVNMNIVPDEINVPNVITPNGDGSNDKLVIKGLNKFVQNEIVIYNRWNNVLYRKQNYQGEWDGQGLNAGTYYYTLKGLDANGQWHTYNGYIMLLR
ncbi:DUF7933 domain-containing protein [Chitinophaga agri]|uniref:DUF11 domain-containing protein n=1 Tax=Chitinophaga agri TaxID=2703787 RepID=A0A6B9ZBN8_9BACT|nr:gliding motility-associated C-terminal domain-containing protein [Chitinophaga agri]QHS59740.1 DUF11 domain-containing protein [Chitinophaga agri]